MDLRQKPRGSHDRKRRAKLRRAKSRRAKIRRARIRRRIFSVIAVAAFAAAVLMFGDYMRMVAREQRDLQLQKELQDAFAATDSEPEPTVAALSASPDISLESAVPQSTLPDEAQVEPTPDVAAERYVSGRFAELMAENPDVIGWIEAGSEISTPVVYRDNDYYMDHDFHGNESKAGTVFIDKLCVEWETDQYKIFYGHNMRDGSMFGRLDEYRNIDYFKANALVTYYSAYNDEVSQYVPFAVLDASMEPGNKEYFFLRQLDIFREPIDRQNIADFVAQLRERSMYSLDSIGAEPGDEIVCLVTCTYDLPDARLLLFCRRLRADETAEDLTRLINETAARR